MSDMAETPVAPLVLAPDDGIRYTARGSEMLFKAVAATTDGAFSLMDRTLPPGGRMPPAHRHDGNAEAEPRHDGGCPGEPEGEVHCGPSSFRVSSAVR